LKTIQKVNTKQARLDKWLWAARFYKTRQLAVSAIKNGKISLNKQRAKPASAVKEQDMISVRRGPYEEIIIVLIVSQQRGSASIAQTLYKETQDSIKQREIIREQLKNQPHNPFGGPKPGKRDVRVNRAVKRWES